MSFQHLDGALYINLEHRKDRKKQILKELEKLELKATRVGAHHDLLNGHKGCCKSHIKALLHAKKKQYKNVLILEDDAVFSCSKEEFYEEISYFFENFNKPFDVFFLGVNVFEHEETSHPKIKRVLVGQAAHAYVVSDKYYDTLIDCFETSLKSMEEDTTFDESLFKALDQNWKGLQGKDRCYVGKILAQQRRSYSDIFHEIRDRKHSDVV